MADTMQVTITKTDGTVVNISGSLSGATITETPPAPSITGVQAASSPSTVSAGATAQCSATVTGTGSFNPAVTWSASAGTITADGVFTAPVAAATVTITATSVQDTSKNATATVVVQAVVVPPPPVNAEPVIPATAVTVDMLPIKTWAVNHDAGTPGDANGTTTYPVAAPDGTANCRQFQFSLISKGGIIYHSNVMKDSSACDTFCMETEEFYPDASNLACIERDIEQADATGAYVDMATQLNGHAGFLDYTSSNPKGWQHTSVKANPMGISKGNWYTTKRYFQNLGGGMVKYIGSNDNGTYSHLDITTKSQPSAIWGKNVLNFQYQFDGASAGSVQSTVYARKMLIHCWKS